MAKATGCAILDQSTINPLTWEFKLPDDTGIIPFHFQVNLWATRAGITYVPRNDEFTLAWKFKPDGAVSMAQHVEARYIFPNLIR